MASLPEPIAQALLRGATVLTPGQRAARALRLAYDQHQRDLGSITWSPPAIFALDTWLAHLWHRMTVAGDAGSLLLNATQEHVLWRQIIVSDPEVSGLRSPDSLAEMAASSWRILCLHSGRNRLKGTGASTDTKAFERWAQSFQRLCFRSAYLPAAQLSEALNIAVAEATLPVPQAGLLLVDFDRILPAHASLFEALRFAGYDVTQYRTATPTTSRTLRSAPSPRAELESCASWAALHLAANPQARIAVVVPDLADRRSEINRVFGQTLPLEHSRSVASSAASPFEFSLGTPLSHAALSTTALHLLRFTLESLPLDAISNLFLSPYFGAVSPSEHLAAAEFDAFHLRQTRLLRPELSLDSLLEVLRSSPYASRLFGLNHRLQLLRHTARSERVVSVQQSYADWSDTFRKLLDAAGWTLAANRDSLSFQTHRRFSSALDELATLDFDGSRPPASPVLTTLTRILDRTIFAPESRQASVQILGPLEIGAVPFDALWFLSAGDLTWPVAPLSTPLISWHLQRSLNIPGSNSAQDRDASQGLTARIANSATEVVFSYAVMHDGGHQRPSPILEHLDLILLPAEPLPQRSAQSALEILLDETTPLPLPDKVVRGGAAILQLQAACGFRAFAEQRLFSTEPQLRAIGLDAGDRGSIVHRVMEEFWSRVHDQSELKALSRADRDALLNECINLALRRSEALAQSSWDHAYLFTQRQRLLLLLRPWLDLERLRPPFAVRAREQEERHAQLGPLRLSLRMDRIDETEAGPVILDYKTGSAAPADWLSDRPDAPQLPLYAVLSKEPVAGVAFAMLRPGDDLCIKGFAQENSASVFGKPSKLAFPTLEDQVEDWRRVLTGLANSFAEGDVAVLPKSYPRTCAYCAQRILCRLDPTTLTDLAAEESEEVSTV